MHCRGLPCHRPPDVRCSQTGPAGLSCSVPDVFTGRLTARSHPIVRDCGGDLARPIVLCRMLRTMCSHEVQGALLLHDLAGHLALWLLAQRLIGPCGQGGLCIHTFKRTRRKTCRWECATVTLWAMVQSPSFACCIGRFVYICWTFATHPVLHATALPASHRCPCRQKRASSYGRASWRLPYIAIPTGLASF